MENDELVTMTLTDVEAKDMRNGDEFPVNLTLVYDPVDPYAVAIGIYSDGYGEVVSWSVGRDLFARAIRGEPPIEYADAQVRAGVSGIYLTLISAVDRSHRTEMRLEVDDVAEFLNETYMLVPHGEESADDLVEEISRFLYNWPDV